MRTRSLTVTLVVAASTLATTLAMAAPATAGYAAAGGQHAPGDIWLGTFVIHSEYSNRCLDADLNTIGRNGTKVQLWDCNGQPQQSWNGYALNGNYGRIEWVNVKSGRCLDADLNHIGSNGDKVQLWDCNRSSQQTWIPGAVMPSGNQYVYTLQNEASPGPKCMDADLNTIGGNGTKVQLWDCITTKFGSPESNQEWVY